MNNAVKSRALTNVEPPLGENNFPHRDYDQRDDSGRSTDLLRDKDNVVIYRSFQAEWKNILLFCISLVVADLLSYSFPNTILSIELFSLGSRSFGTLVPILAFIPLLFFLLILRNVRNVRWVIGLTSLVELNGLASFAANTREIYFENIRAIEVKQNLIERLLGIGSITIGDLMMQESDIELSGVRHPRQTKSVLERRIRSMKSTPPV